ncbi:putative magnesium transporter NIPA3 [Smittium culicis]|uniref:Putative magnesium transporter NIPA3 n=1 Tax=Smittium culicis TaxID=133412 RepID=A0A1R1XDX4_9FUNG|nr:putative magnesium transporter NIPA3 [Smittium culicis]OMJ16023.1 putative magnesium transporter NIPA3 [Smittium culicis]
MVDPKYVGMTLALVSSLAIGSSFVLTKMGLNSASKKYGSATKGLNYFKSKIWWLGMIFMAIGEFANFAAYSFAPAILVTPLGALSVIVGAILASLILGERINSVGKAGCALCLLGALQFRGGLCVYHVHGSALWIADAAGLLDDMFAERQFHRSCVQGPGHIDQADARGQEPAEVRVDVRVLASRRRLHHAAAQLLQPGAGQLRHERRDAHLLRALHNTDHRCQHDTVQRVQRHSRRVRVHPQRVLHAVYRRVPAQPLEIGRGCKRQRRHHGLRQLVRELDFNARYSGKNGARLSNSNSIDDSGYGYVYTNGSSGDEHNGSDSLFDLERNSSCDEIDRNNNFPLKHTGVSKNGYEQILFEAP